MTLDVNYPNKWEADYRRGTDGWDLDGPTPALQRLAESGQFAPGRMLVPCAGRGHDAREFARHGFDVTAVDFSEYAVGEMKRLVDPQAPIQIVQQDLFEPAACVGCVLRLRSAIYVFLRDRSESPRRLCRHHPAGAKAGWYLHRPGISAGWKSRWTAVRGNGD